MNRTVKRISLFTLAAVMSFGMLIAPAAEAASSVPSKSAQKSFVRSSDAFSVNLFKKCAVHQRSNTVIAPMSVMTALAMTANGAEGRTLSQIEKTIAGGKSINATNRNVHYWYSKLPSTGGASLKNANSVWYRSSASVSGNFQQTVKDCYGADVNAADFSDSSTVNKMNDWVSKATDGKIPSIISSISSEDVLYILNAVSFDAKWDEPYYSNSVKSAYFRQENGSRQKIKLMSSDEYCYISDKNTTGFIKEYKDGYSFVALLPRKGITLSKYISNMSGTSFRRLINNRKKAGVAAYLPEFKTEYSADMNGALKSMGVKDAFSTRADFSGIDAVQPVRISGIRHKVYINVTPEGTTAGAATSVQVPMGPMPITKTVRLNRPFVYAVTDDSTGLPIFMGAVRNI